MGQGFNMKNSETSDLVTQDFKEGATLLSQMGVAGETYVNLRARHVKGAFVSKTKLAFYQSIFDILLSMRRMERTAKKLEELAISLNKPLDQ